MAVYTDVSPEDLSDFLENYNLGTLLSVKGIAEGVENSNFLLHVTSGTYILTLFEKRTNKADLPFFLGLMEHLSGKGITCPLPVKNKAGEALSELCGRPATIITFLEGFSVRRVDRNHCFEVGEVLAKFHNGSADFKLTRPNALTLKDWRPLFNKSGEAANSVQTGLYDLINNELDFLEQHYPKTLPQGVLHADLFTDNVFFLNNHLSGIIDFYFACNDFLVYDLAICLNAWCFDNPTTFDYSKGSAMIAGYMQHRALSKEEQEALPILARGSALRFLLTRLYDWLNVPEGALVRPKDPLEYVNKLRFHQKIKSAKEYGL